MSTAELGMTCASTSFECVRRMRASEYRFPLRPAAAAGAGTSGRRTFSLMLELDSIDSDQLEVVQPFAVALRGDTDGDNFVAKFSDANISASGDSFPEAIGNLVDLIETKFLHFSELPLTQLGTEPRRQLAILRQFFRTP